MKSRIYPKADVKTQWWEAKFDRGPFPRIDKVLLHSTETEGWPGYKDGASAPTLTYHPRLRQWRQHNYLDSSARALVDPEGTPVRENRDNVIQIEIIGYADEIKADTVGGLYISRLSDDHLRDIADFLRWLHAEWDFPLQCTVPFVAYRPYRNVRLSSSAYDAYRGVLGHQHASGNTHTDPGNININKIMQFAGSATNTEEDDFMAMTPEERAAFIADMAEAVGNIRVKRPGTVDQMWALKDGLWSANYYAMQAALSNPDVDETALARDLAPLMHAPLVAALETTLANIPALNATEVATATVDLLVQRAAE